MQQYIKNYLKYFDLGEQELLTCEACGRQGRVDNSGFDIHHINGRGTGKNCIDNLICLCRRCHSLCHDGKLSKGEMEYIHNNYLLGNKKQFVK